MDALVTSTDPDASLDADQKLVRCGPHDIEYNAASASLRPAYEKGVFIMPDVAIGAELSSTDGVATSADEPRVDSLERIPAARVDAVVVPDNWGGLFEHTAQVCEEQHADENQDLGEHKPAVLTDDVCTWIRVDGGLTSSDPDAPASITPTPTPAPTASTAVSACVKANAPMEISPVQYQRQIQELAKPSSSPFQATASKEEELRAIPSCGYDGSLDDDPESGVAHIDKPRDRAVGHVGRALAAASALRADAVGAAGGGQLQLGDLMAFVFPINTTTTPRAPSLVLLYFSGIDVSGAVPADVLTGLTYLHEDCDAIHRQPPRRVQARRHSAMPTLLPPRDAATGSPIPTLPRDAFWMVLAADLSKYGILSIPAAQVFDDMWSSNSPTAASLRTSMLASMAPFLKLDDL